MAATLVDKMAQEEYATEAERTRDEGIAEGVCASAYIAGSDTVSFVLIVESVTLA
jgi:sulfopyruvate decarboxylase TPP-binding subunit